MEIFEIKEFKLIAGLVEEVQIFHANLFQDKGFILYRSKLFKLLN